LFGSFNYDEEIVKQIVNPKEFSIKRMGNLSEAEKQKVYLIRALLSNAQVLILDEVFGNIEELEKTRLLRVVHDNKHDKVVIVIDAKLSKTDKKVFDAI